MSNAEELKAQGIKLFQQKEYEAAARIFREAQETYETAGQRDMAAEMLTNVGLVHRALGEQQQALDSMQEAMKTFEELNDSLRLAKVMGNLGGVYSALGDREQAYNCYRRAADVFQELGETKLHGETLLAMGNLQVREGKIGAGAATYEAGLEELDQLTPTQRVLKGLIGIRNRVIGGGGGKARTNDTPAATQDQAPPPPTTNNDENAS
ncbi:MAG: tetratricopeptide repeat protein [Chloroflexi bacterium]|nr:tetratricopeptide repeat protein [Chloroflexota bacterium]